MRRLRGGRSSPAPPADYYGHNGQAAWQQQQPEPSTPGMDLTPRPQQPYGGPSATTTPLQQQQQQQPWFSAPHPAPLGTPFPPSTPMQGYGSVAPGAGAATTYDAGEVSPLVRAGLIVNPLSGRSIKIGGDVYNRLVEQGFTPDVASGRLQPPALAQTPGSVGAGAVSSPDTGSPLLSGARHRRLRSRAGG